MFFIKYNSRQKYKNMILALEPAINIRVKFKYLQKLFLKHKNAIYNSFNFYNSRKIRTNASVFTTMKKQ